MKFIGLILVCSIVCTNSLTISDTTQPKSLDVEPVSVAEDVSPALEKLTLTRADERLGVWRTDKGDLVKIIPFVGEPNQEPAANLVHSFVRRRQDAPGMTMRSETPLCDLADHNKQATRRMIPSNKNSEGSNRAGRTFWPFTNWFYDPYYDPYYPPPPMPMPYPPPYMPPQPYGPW